MKRIHRVSLVSLSSLALLGVAAGCADAPNETHASETAAVGQLRFAFELDSSIAINIIHYEIDGEGGYHTSGDIDVGASSKISHAIPSIPVGAHVIKLSASAAGGEATCVSESAFQVRAHKTTSVNINLQCRLASKAGTAVIAGQVNVCPIIEGLAASPDHVVVGETLDLLVVVKDSDEGPSPLSYQWSASSGTLSDASAESPTLTATQAGTATVTLTVSDGDCTDSWSVDVVAARAPDVAPNVNFAKTPKQGAVTLAPGQFEFTCDQNGCDYSCSLDDGAFVPCESPVTVPRLSEGTHNFKVRGTHGTSEQGPVAEYAFTTRRPNIVTIIADDLGFSDTGPLGSEIDTPNLNALADTGRLLTNHYVGAVCAITRSMLISGTDNHLVGEGTMGAPNDERAGLPGYEGYLNDRALSVAQLLKDGGYHTYIAGKWHLGSRLVGGNSGSGKTADQWGFERSFTVLGGGVGNHFAHETANSTTYTKDGAYIRPGQPGAPSGFDGDLYTEQLIEFIDTNIQDGKPFFAYAAYTEPHWPLQAPQAWLDKYKGKYDNGYGPVAAARLKRLQDRGIIPTTLVPSPGFPEALTRPAGTPANNTTSAKYVSAVNTAAQGYTDYGQGAVIKNWESLSALEKKTQAKYMEIYAAMVDHLDYNIGRLVQHLKDIGEYDRTFIIFHSDSGAESWPVNSGADPKANDENYASDAIFPTLGGDNGTANARNIKYGIRWSEVSNTPLSQFKGFQGAGGLTAPAIVHLPGQTASLPPVHHFTHVTDDTATFLDLADVASPSEPAPPNVDPATGIDKNQGKVIYDNRYVYPVTGISLLPTLAEENPGLVHTAAFGGESYGRAYIISSDGKWKARWTEPPYGPIDGHWQLYAIETDRGEVEDLAATYPTVLADLVDRWKQYMTRVGGVEPLRPRGYY